VRAVYEELKVPYHPRTSEDPLKNQKDLSHHFIRTAPAGEENDGFYVVDLGTTIMQMMKWRRHLPMVRPFYAMKCNPNPTLLKMLAAMGAGFDCASQAEFMEIVDNKLATLDDIIFANPCKQIPHMKKAREVGIKYVTFDNEEELHKIAKHWPEAKCVLRIATNDAKSLCKFSVKFGCPWPHYPHLLKVAASLKIDIVGVSFHVGSGCGDATVHLESAKVAYEIFNAGKEYGFNMNLLDIGGGFPGLDTAPLTFEAIAAELRPYLESNFAETRIIAEPGRYFAEPLQTLVMNVFGKRLVPLEGTDEMEYQYYVSDGLYHSFNCIIFDHAVPLVHPLVSRDSAGTKTSTMYGPTCDSMDCLFKRQPFPEVHVGDWLVVPAFGAYTTAAAGNFNGFVTKRFEYISSIPLIEEQP
jgi:diaminopimelate decarboxylase